MIVEEVFPGWQTVAVEPATTAGLGWPMSRTAPQWYRFRRPNWLDREQSSCAIARRRG